MFTIIIIIFSSIYCSSTAKPRKEEGTESFWLGNEIAIGLVKLKWSCNDMLLCDGQCRFLFNLWSSFTANRHWYDCSFISADHKHNPFFHSALMPQYSRLILTINFNYIAIFLVSAYLIGLPISSCRRRRFRLNMRNDRELVFYDKSAMVNCRKRASMQLTIRKSILLAYWIRWFQWTLLSVRLKSLRWIHFWKVHFSC